MNVWKAAGRAGIPGCVLRACAEQLARVSIDIYNLSLDQAVVPTSFRTATIALVPKNFKAMALNDFHPVAFTPIIAKCLETLVLSHPKSCLLTTLDPHQFAYRTNRSTEDAISTALCPDPPGQSQLSLYICYIYSSFQLCFTCMSTSLLCITYLIYVGHHC